MSGKDPPCCSYRKFQFHLIFSIFKALSDSTNSGSVKNKLAIIFSIIAMYRVEAKGT